MSGNEPRLVIDPPEVKPRRFGLYSVAERLPGNQYALMGVEIADSGLNCDFFNVDVTTFDACDTIDLEGMESTSNSTAEFDPLVLTMLDDCAGPAQFNDSRNRAIKRFAMAEERGVEFHLGSLLAANADDISGTTVDLPTSMALLEEWLDMNYGGQGTIIGSRAAVSLLSKNGSVKRYGNRLETEQGNLVAGMRLASGGPEGNTPEAGETILWATGIIRIHEGVMVALDPMFVSTTSASEPEVQTVVITGTPAGGTFTLTFQGQTTTGIAYNANAAAVQSALIALSNLDTGDVVVTGTNPNFTVTFGGAYAGLNPGQITATSSLTGGTSPGVTTATTTSGFSGETDNTWRTMVQKPFLVTLDCAAAGIEATLSA